MGSDKNETKRVKITSRPKKSKNEKKSKVKFKDKHPKASRAIKITILVIVLLSIIGAGVLVGAIIGIFGDELKIDEESLVVGYENSTVYDADGNYIATLSGGTKRKSISLSDMSEYLPKAYVAIEDERFYEHSGIDIGRTSYATITYILHGGSSSFGGSTITQQVIKNITKEKDNTALAGVMRKVKEISKAIQVEKYLSKDQILELYLNLIFVGGDDINGVELGSIYYFDKSAKDLDIAECAFLAGINNSPNAYKPFATYEGDEKAEEKKAAMTEKINKRAKTVLGKMLEVNYISEDQYKEAMAEIDEGLKFKKGESANVTTDVSYLTEAAIDQILDQIMADNEDMSRDMAEMTLYSSGLKIYTTQKSDIQKTLEDELVKEKYITSYTSTNKETGEKEKNYSIPTMVIIDHTTGQVVAAATATGDPENRSAITKLGYFNYPTSIHKQTGSSMKPISVIAPGLENGVITGATVYDDCPTNWGSWAPKEWYAGFKGLMNMRTAIEISANIPHAKALSNIGVEKSVEFCKSVGLPDFTDSGLSLALGGLDEGVSPFQMAVAYAAIANNGVYITPTFYTKVLDKNDKVVYEPVREERRVMSEQNAYIEQNILTQTVVGGAGTATYCAIPGMEVAAKTGTTNDDYDRWLSGFTPYYTATCWYGYVQNSEVHYSNGNPAGRIWSAVMKDIHTELENKRFTEPEGIVRVAVCRQSGLKATERCGGNVYTELFTNESVPKDACDGHTGAYVICVDTGLLAVDPCPNKAETGGYLPVRERDTIWTSQHTAAANPGAYCTAHAGGGASYVTQEDQIKFQAATDAAAMGLFGTDADNYINQKLQEWRSGGGAAQSVPQQPAPQANTQKPKPETQTTPATNPTPETPKPTTPETTKPSGGETTPPATNPTPETPKPTTPEQPTPGGETTTPSEQSV